MPTRGSPSLAPESGSEDDPPPQPPDEGTRLRPLVERIGHAVYVTAPERGMVVYANRAYRRIFGMDAPHAVAQRLERVHPRDRDEVRDSIGRQRDGEATELEYRIVAPDGTVRWIRDRAFPAGGGDEGSVRVVGLAEDVTEWRRVESDRELLASTARFLSTSLERDQILQGLGRLVVPRLADWCRIHLLLPDGSLEGVPAAHADPQRVELVRRLDRDHPPSPEVEGGIHDVARTGRSTLLVDTSPEAVVGPSGSAKETELVEALGLRSVMIVPLRSRDRILGAMTLVSGDAMRRYGRRDLELAEELAARAALALDHAILLEAERMARREAEEARREAEEASRAKTDFLAVMSHELRTPLNAIVGYGDLLESEVAGPVTEGQRRHLARIRASAWQLLELIEEILSLSRIEAGRAEVVWEEMEAGEVARRAVERVRPEAARKQLDVRLEGPEEPVIVRADRARLRQVLLNLLSNAVKFTEAGVIVLSYESVDDRVRFHVRDSGPGIPDERQESIFQPFSQTGRSERDEEGVGLGLAVSRRFARLMEGDVTVESSPGQGSVFTVTLPASRNGQP